VETSDNSDKLSADSRITFPHLSPFKHNNHHSIQTRCALTPNHPPDRPAEMFK